MQPIDKVREESEMASRIRSFNPRVGDTPADYDQHGRTLMDLVVHIVAHKPSSTQDRKRHRILIRFSMAMMATLRSAVREKSRVYLSDLNQLDDAQFERIIEGLHYMRASAQQLAHRSKQPDQAH